MPSVSKAQQRATAIELEHRKAGGKPRRFKDMNLDQLEDFASTPQTGLPPRIRAGSSRVRANARRGHKP